MSGDSSVVRGPLKGYHHETYVLPLWDGSRFVKCREPREQILWFDRRCFQSEEELLRALQGHITRVPEVVDIEGMGLQGFIEGRTLGRSNWWTRRIPEAVFEQIVDLFREMVRVTPDMLSVQRRCESVDRPRDGDSDGFLERLIVFTEQQVYDRNRKRFERLFSELGVEDGSFKYLRRHVAGLVERPFCLLHGDLHRENLIIDPQGQLWAIDWELALLGDPLYDLATHLHLMRYPAAQEQRMVREWHAAVERIRPGSARGLTKDLCRIVDFKRAQSVITDVIRLSLSLYDGADFDWRRLPLVARKLRMALAAAAIPLGLTEVPNHSRIMAALARWHSTVNRGPGETNTLKDNLS
jgi:aminoglycoside phosphotransferase (APT) family kinase protein